MVNSLGSSQFSQVPGSYGASKTHKAKETQKHEPAQNQGIAFQPQTPASGQQPLSLTGSTLNTIA